MPGIRLMLRRKSAGAHVAASQRDLVADGVARGVAEPSAGREGGGGPGGHPRADHEGSRTGRSRLSSHFAMERRCT